jgi:hypothetical protein
MHKAEQFESDKQVYSPIVASKSDHFGDFVNIGLDEDPPFKIL